MKVLVACEESGRVTGALRAIGVDAYSCDLQDTTGEHPEFHLKQDVREVLDLKWGAILAFPPCTDLSNAGAGHFKEKISNGWQEQAIEFFMRFVDHPCSLISIENPVGIMSTKYRKPDQIIEPRDFGDPVCKRTCLWLKGLPRLKPTKFVQGDGIYTSPTGKTMSNWMYETSKLLPSDRAVVRSKTFPGIAKAMAEQWGPLLA